MMAEAPTTADTARIVTDDQKNDMDTTTKLVVLGVIFAILLALIALILAIVGVAGNGGAEVYIGTDGTGMSNADYGDKVWMFQIGHFAGNTQYLNTATGTIEGYNVDVVNAVCQIAGRNCRLVWDLYERCWDSQAGQRPRGGIGLMGRWYDACVGWANTRDRARIYIFSDSFEKTFRLSYWVKAGGSFDYPNFGGLKVGFLDGWSVDEHCVDRYTDVVGFDPTDTDQVMHYQKESDVIAALKNNMIDVAALPRFGYLEDNADISLGYQPDMELCVNGGPAMMMPKDQQNLAAWFNEGFRSLKGSSEYHAICNRIEEAHGDQPGYDKNDVCLD